MQIEFKGVDANTFARAVEHLQTLGGESLSVFPATRQGEGPWLIAYVYVDGRRHVRSTTDNWRGRSLEAQAVDLARKLEALTPKGDDGNHPF